MPDKQSIAVRVALLEEQMATQKEIREDVKVIRSTVQRFEVQLAQTPTWSQMKPLYDKVEQIEMEHERAKGARKVLIAVGSVISACSGVIGVVVTKLFSHPAAAQHTSDIVKGASTLLK